MPTIAPFVLPTPSEVASPAALDTIAAAAQAASDAVTARDAQAMVRVHLDLVRVLAVGCGAAWGQEPCAAAAVLLSRMAVPVLDADLCDESPESRAIDAVEAAVITDCLGLNLLTLLAHRPVAQA